jgi:uncharacterized protein YndB with AHSA1/START domain
MTDPPENRPEIDPEVDLVLERVVDVPPSLLWRCWTEPKHLVRWFTPKPWETVACEIDLRPGGLFSTTMQSPDGTVMPRSNGCYLEVVPEKKLVFTDALGPGYRPNAAPFMTAYILFEPDRATRTRYVAIVQHADEATKKRHEEMGFHQGWGTALEQLVAHAKTLDL